MMQNSGDSFISFRKLVIAVLLALNTSTLSLAADKTHHFGFSKPDKIYPDDSIQLTISALQNDGTVDVESVRHLQVSVTSRQSSASYDVDLSQGQATLTVKAGPSGSYLVWIKDKSDSKLSKSASFRVLDPQFKGKEGQ